MTRVAPGDDVDYVTDALGGARAIPTVKIQRLAWERGDVCTVVSDGGGDCGVRRGQLHLDDRCVGRCLNSDAADESIGVGTTNREPRR